MSIIIRCVCERRIIATRREMLAETRTQLLRAARHAFGTKVYAEA